MANMAVIHEISARADSSDAATLLRSDVHRHAFANSASLPDFEPSRVTAIAQRVRRSSESSKRIYHAAGSDRRVPGHVYMRDQLAVRANHDVGADDEVGTDRGALADHSAVFNPRGGIDCAHGPVFANIAVDVREFSVVTATSPDCLVTYGYPVFRPVRRQAYQRLCASVRQHRADIGFGNRGAVDLGVAVKPPHALAAADAAHVILHGIAGHHRLAELALVDGEKINRARLLGAFDRLDADHAGGLRHRLAHHHSGVDRALRKVPEKRQLVEGDVLDADAGIIGADVEHPVDQQHGKAMRQRLEDFIDIDDRESDRGLLLHHSRPSPLGGVAPSRTRRSTATISRNHCLVGLAKKPPQRPLAGMSSLTALIAVTWAPSPMRRWLLMPTLAPSATLSPMVSLPASPI